MMDMGINGPHRLPDLDLPAGRGSSVNAAGSIQLVQQAELIAAAHNQVLRQLNAAQFVSLANRTGHTLLVEISQSTAMQSPIPILLERDEEKHLTLPFQAFQVLVTDLTLNLDPYVPGLTREDKSTGRRHGSSFPYIKSTGALVIPDPNAQPNGALVITQANVPLVVNQAYSTLQPTINFSQQFTAVGAGSQTLISNICATSTFLDAAGYFVGYHAFNPSSAVSNLTVSAYSPDSTASNPAPQSFPPGVLVYVPVEADQLAIVAGGAGQWVQAYQPVRYFTQNV